MTTRLSPYGRADYSEATAMVGGKGKTVPKLAARMPSAEVVAKVGVVGAIMAGRGRAHRVIRRKAV